MSRNAYKFSAAVASLLFAVGLTACGSSHREANANPASVARVADEAVCRTCHSSTLDPVSGTPIVADFLTATNSHNQPGRANTDLGCEGCHGGGSEHNGVGPIPFPDPLAANRCITCHTAGGLAPTTANLQPLFDQAKSGGWITNNCTHCHTDSGVGSIHGAKVPTTENCVVCHDVAGPQHGANLVGDNNGVRAIVPEFSKRSHHITGGAPTAAQCSVCHLEGKSDGAGGIMVDGTFHMADGKIHLRDVDNASGGFAWDGTNHTDMDNFCFNCHDANGASDLVTLGGLVPTATAGNPFGDTLTNGYDQVARARVADVKTAFTTSNASHHAVSGQRYVYRFSTAANAAAWAARTGKPVPPASQIAEGHTDASPNGGTITGFGTGLTFDPAGPEEGGDATLYEAGKFVSTYIPLGATQTVGDNSTLHCGDCHTVGQWKPGTSTNADGSATTVAIGAHGSANEYLLRNSLGTDAIHNSLTYVCFNCHVAGVQAATAALWAEKVAEGLIADSVAPLVGSAANPTGNYIPVQVPTMKAGWNALHPNVFSGQIFGYATAHAVSAMHVQCIADSADNIGLPNRLNNSWFSAGVKTLDFIPAPGATVVAPTTATDSLSGNVTGIGCTNCHNSGLRTGFGGIHGGNLTYVDGLGRTQTTYRFMPGMGNYRYAPPGGWDGKEVSDPTLLTQHNPLYPGTPGSRTDQAVGYPGPSGKPMGGCYTNGSAAGGTNDPNPAGYSSCSHHGTSTNTSVGNLATKPANFRDTYGGGTTGNPTTFEPTVREATAGGVLVTRPLKY
jgi:hypothetical protein